MPPGSGSDRPGPPGAVEAEYRRLSPLLREIAEKKFNVPPHEAEALVNDVFTSFLLRGGSVRNPEKWLVGAVCHASRAYWRRASRTEPLPENVPELADPATVDREERLVSRLTLALAVNHLGERCRRVLRLYYVDGYSVSELAVHLGTTRAYAAQVLHDCRRRLRLVCRRLTRERTR